MAKFEKILEIKVVEEKGIVTMLITRGANGTSAMFPTILEGKSGQELIDILDEVEEVLMRKRSELLNKDFFEKHRTDAK
jgi:hypothetical protein